MILHNDNTPAFIRHYIFILACINTYRNSNVTTRKTRWTRMILSFLNSRNRKDLLTKPRIDPVQLLYVRFTYMRRPSLYKTGTFNTLETENFDDKFISISCSWSSFHYQKRGIFRIARKCFLGTPCLVVSLACSRFKQHNCM